MKNKSPREKGKIKFSQWFKKLIKGDKVAIIGSLDAPFHFPKRMIGKTGIVLGERGSYKVVEAKDGNMTKTFIIHPIHLKKIEK